MSFSWKDESKKEPSREQAERVPAGQHDLEIKNVVLGSKSKGWFKSKKGDRQIMVVFRDSADREVVQMYTMSTAAIPIFAQLIEGCGLDLEALDKDGVKPESFLEQSFADANLVGRQCRGQVDYEKSDSDGKEYARVKIMPAVMAGADADDGIPI